MIWWLNQILIKGFYVCVSTYTHTWKYWDKNHINGIIQAILFSLSFFSLSLLLTLCPIIFFSLIPLSLSSDRINVLDLSFYSFTSRPLRKMTPRDLKLWALSPESFFCMLCPIRRSISQVCSGWPCPSSTTFTTGKLSPVTTGKLSLVKT